MCQIIDCVKGLTQRRACMNMSEIWGLTAENQHRKYGDSAKSKLRRDLIPACLKITFHLLLDFHTSPNKAHKCSLIKQACNESGRDRILQAYGWNGKWACRNNRGKTWGCNYSQIDRDLFKQWIHERLGHANLTPWMLTCTSTFFEKHQQHGVQTFFSFILKIRCTSLDTAGKQTGLRFLCHTIDDW